MHTNIRSYPASLRAFIDRLLELGPIYYAAGREIAALQPAREGPSGLTLAELAGRRRLMGAVPSDEDAMRPIAAHSTTPPTARER
jgi:hypothetical protein